MAGLYPATCCLFSITHILFYHYKWCNRLNELRLYYLTDPKFPLKPILQEGLMGNGFGQASLEDKDESKFSLVHAIHCRVCMTRLL